MKLFVYRCLAVMMMVGVMQGKAFGGLSKEELCATPPLISAKISPDGKTIAFVGADDQGIPNLFINDREQLTFFNTPDITQLFWSADSQRLLLLKEDDGTGKPTLYGIHIDTKDQVAYAGEFPDAHVKVLKVASELNTALIGINHRDSYFMIFIVLTWIRGSLSWSFKMINFAGS